MDKFMNKSISLLTSVAFLLTGLPVSYAQGMTSPLPSGRVDFSIPYQTPTLKGIRIYQDNPFRFDFILDKGASNQNNDSLKDESGKLIRYFLAALTIPQTDMWVNLSPYEKDHIVPEAFGQTEMGRDLLAQDYLLKQITASVIYPEGKIGKEFWNRVYAEVFKLYGTTDIPIDTFNKVWILPDKAEVYENAGSGTAYIVESNLKVMLESDYKALGVAGKSMPDQQWKDIKSAPMVDLAKDILREIVIPTLTKEVNEGKNFAQLRQVYQSLILAAWYKRKIREGLLATAYVDRNKVKGVNIDDPLESEKIWHKYVESFKQGAYNYIKEERDMSSDEIIPRKYFSGGVDYSMFSVVLHVKDAAQIPGWTKGLAVAALLLLEVAIQPVGVEAVAVDPATVNDLTIEKANDQPKLTMEEQGSNPGTLLFKFPPRVINYLDIRSNEIFSGLDYQNDFKYSGELVIGANAGLQERLKNILGEALNNGVNVDVANRLLFLGDQYGDDRVRELFGFLKGLFGDAAVRGRIDILEGVGFHKEWRERLERLLPVAVEVFGNDILRQPRGLELLHFLEPNNRMELNFSFVPIGNNDSLEDRRKQVYAAYVDNIRQLVKVLKVEFEERTNPSLVKELGGMLQTTSLDRMTGFLKGLGAELPVEVVDHLSQHPAILISLVNNHGNDPKSFFKIVRILAKEYKVSPEELINVASLRSLVTVFKSNNSVDEIRVSLTRVLGKEIVSQLLPREHIQSLKGLADMPNDFLEDPETACLKIGLPQDLVKIFFSSWRSANTLIVWHSREITTYRHEVSVLWREANKRMGTDLVNMLIKEDAYALFKLFQIMDKNGFNVIKEDLARKIRAIHDLYSGKNTASFLAAIKELKPVSYDVDETSIAQANRQLRDYYLNALFFMVSSGMSTEENLSPLRIKAMILSYILHTELVPGMNNAFSSGEFGTELLRTLDGEPSLVLGIVSHEIAHKLFGASEAAADIWAFGFLSKIGYSKAIVRLQEFLQYEQANAETGEIHDLGRAAVKSLIEAIKTFNKTMDVDWERLANIMWDIDISQHSEEELAKRLFVRYVQPGLNEKQKAFLNNSEELEKITNLSSIVETLQKLTDDSTQSERSANPGGIDLNTNTLDVTIKSPGAEIKYNIDPAMIESLNNVAGLTPVVVLIQPLNSLAQFMGN